MYNPLIHIYLFSALSNVLPNTETMPRPNTESQGGQVDKFNGVNDTNGAIYTPTSAAPRPCPPNDCTNFAPPKEWCRLDPSQAL